jgi:hypothetical protein
MNGPSPRLPLARLLREAAWAPIGVVVLHAIAGALLGHEPYVDPVMHFLGGVAMAYFTVRACEVGVELVGRLTPLGQSVLAFGVTCSAAVFWELVEFGRDRILHTNVQISLSNTMRDLVLGCLGAVVYLALRATRRPRSPD